MEREVEIRDGKRVEVDLEWEVYVGRDVKMGSKSLQESRKVGKWEEGKEAGEEMGKKEVGN